jgi:ribosomal protein L37AE/L43A
MAALDDDLYRVEETVCSINSGNLKPGGWDCDHIHAHGAAGQRNPLGNAVDHLLANPNADNLRLVRFMLSGELEKQGICKPKDSIDVATDALRWWADQRCPHCGGRGVTDFQQHQCQQCGGSGEKPRPSYKPVSDAIGVINQAVTRMEGQLRSSLKGATYLASTPSGVTLKKPSLDDYDKRPELWNSGG